MFKKFLESLQAVNRKILYVIKVGVGKVLFVMAGWFWWQHIYTTPERVFWGMLDTNLSTPGIARRVTQKSGGGSMQQDLQLTLGAQNAAHSIITITQQGEGGASNVTSETIGTTAADYVRYVNIQTPPQAGKATDYRNVVGVWGKGQDTNGKQVGQLLNEALLNTVPFANLSRDKRVALIDAIREKGTYKVDFGKTKSGREAGQAVYTYEVEVHPQAYVQLLQQFAKHIGLGDLDGLDPSSYEGAPPTTVQFVVGRNSRQLVAVRYIDQERTETYTGYGVQPAIVTPAQNIPLSELQSRIQQVRQ
jgi:hypothetical protein